MRPGARRRSASGAVACAARAVAAWPAFQEGVKSIEDPEGPHVRRVHLRAMNNRTKKVQTQFDPSNAGAERLAYSSGAAERSRALPLRTAQNGVTAQETLTVSLAQ
jgi:hypothetical protein